MIVWATRGGAVLLLCCPAVQASLVSEAALVSGAAHVSEAALVRASALSSEASEDSASGWEGSSARPKSGRASNERKARIAGQ